MNNAGARGGWLTRMRGGLRKSSTALTSGIARILSDRRIDANVLEDLEELLISADLGVSSAAELVHRLSSSKLNDKSAQGVRKYLAHAIGDMLRPVTKPLTFDSGHTPHVVLVVGVNGTGKTTTIAKLAAQLQHSGKIVLLAAGDTFRAAAIEQLEIWGKRLSCPVIVRPIGTDPAAVAYESLVQAQTNGADVLLIDTAGRLHNKADLMAQLQKVVKVLKKLDPSAPHDSVLIIDSTTGQNALAQVQAFIDLVSVTGLIVTKLDGSARGGIVVALAQRFGLPIHAVGVGESTDDLQPFDPDAFAEALLGIKQ